MLQDDQAEEKKQLEESQRTDAAKLATKQQDEKDAEVDRLSDVEEAARLERQEAEAIATEKAAEQAKAEESKKAL